MARTSKKKQEIRKKPVKIYYVGIYARLSVDSGDRKNESIETQVEIIKAFIAQHDMVFIRIWERPAPALSGKGLSA